MTWFSYHVQCIITVDVIFTVHSSYENERYVVCLKLSFETIFL